MSFCLKRVFFFFFNSIIKIGRFKLCTVFLKSFKSQDSWHDGVSPKVSDQSSNKELKGFLEGSEKIPTILWS